MTTRPYRRPTQGSVLPLVGMVVLGVVVLGSLHAGKPAAAAAVPSSVPPGTVQQWIDRADQVLAAGGIPAGVLNRADQWIIINGESGGNPNAINLWDSNAQAGHPSKGLMQCIDSTFQTYREPSLPDDVYDPVANIVAGVRYALHRYGSLDDVPGVVAVRDHQGYVGY